MRSILYLIDIMHWRGGTEIHLIELSTRLAAYGFHPIVCNLGGDEPVLRDLAEMDVETWPRALKRLYLPEGQAVGRAIAREASTRDVHAVQTFHFKSDWLGVSVARALRCPLISSRRDLGFHRNALRRTVYRMVNPHVDAYIAPSQAVKDATVRNDRVPPERVHVIPNGLDLARFEAPQCRKDARAWLGLPADGPVVGMVSGFRPIKDHPTLLRAFARVVERSPDAHLALIGEGTEEAVLRALTAELGLQGRVTFTGPRGDIPRALAALDLFVLASHSEGMSNAILEAMAAGLPVVASNVGGNAECVVDGVTGRIVPPADEDAMAAAIAGLLDDRTAAAAMGAAGRARAQETFDVNAMVRRTAELYRALRPEGAAHARR